MTLVRLLYASRAAAPVNADDMAAILRQCRAHNPPQGITGVLCCSDDMYMQVLEGGRPAVNRLYARITDWVMSRPQIQEEAVTMLADELMQRVRPDGLAIVMEADHFCMHWRGVKDTDTAMVNSVMRGAFLKDSNLRREFLSLLPRKPD